MLTYPSGPPLRSQFLLDLKARFLAGPRLWVKQLELQEVGDDELSYEALSVVSKVHILDLSVYQQLTVWGDQLAMFGVREDVRKRMDRLILGVHEFPLVAEPTKIVEAYQWAESQLYSLGSPPGASEADRERLRNIETRWSTLSAAH